MSTSSESTCVEGINDDKPTTPVDAVWHTLRAHIADMQCSPLKRDRLERLTNQMELVWNKVSNAEAVVETANQTSRPRHRMYIKTKPEHHPTANT